MPALKEVYISLDAWREAIYGNNDLEALLQPTIDVKFIRVTYYESFSTIQ